MKRFKAIRWILTMACIVVCLMGINYAYFTGQLTISSKIKTANMKYSFSNGGNILNITLDSEVTINLLNLPKNETYILTYSLKSNSKNVPLKKIENKNIGSISIDLKDIEITQDNKDLEVSTLVNNSIPKSLGTFDCYHDFDGVNGTITLIKQSEPTNLNLVINKNELTIDEQKQLGIEESLVEQIIIDNTSASQILKKENKGTDTQLDQETQIVETMQIKEELKERTVINIDATYGFEIPLEYLQFNANVN